MANETEDGAPGAHTSQEGRPHWFFAPIPTGRFLMGGATTGGLISQHDVQITRAFEMQKYPVTQAMWESVMGSNPSHFKLCGSDCPVEQVSWDDVQEFLSKVNARNDGYHYRLPSEAEWEYAACAGTTGAYYGRLDEVAWFIGNSHGQPHPVGQKRPNPWGLYDMLGNVWEWVEDEQEWRGRGLRGGCWGNAATLLEASYRNFESPKKQSKGVGFRVVREKINT